MWVSEERMRRGPVIGKPADARRARARLLQLLLVRGVLRIIARSIPSLDPARISPGRFRADDLHRSTPPPPTLDKRKPEEIPVEMIPETEKVCQSSEAAVRSGGEADYHQEKTGSEAEKEAASVTAWKRYQQLVAAVESRGGNFNRKLMLEAIFRGNDLVYASH